VLAAHPSIPGGQSWRSGYSEGYAREFVSAQSRAGKLQTVMFLGRVVPLAAGVAVALLAYTLAKRLFSRAAGLLAATVWLTLPFTLGLSHLNGVDVPFTLTTLVLALAVLRYVRGPTTRAALLVGLACGVGLTVSLAALVLVPTSAAVVLLVGSRHLARALRHVLLIGVSSWAVVWLLYRLVSPFPEVRHADPVPAGPDPVLARLTRFVPWPSEYDYGISKQALIAAKPGRAYLLGHAWEGARWWFWPGSALVKLSASAFIIVLVGLMCWRRLPRRTIFEAALVLVVLLWPSRPSSFLSRASWDCGTCFPSSRWQSSQAHRPSALRPRLPPGASRSRSSLPHSCFGSGNQHHDRSHGRLRRSDLVTRPPPTRIWTGARTCTDYAIGFGIIRVRSFSILEPLTRRRCFKGRGHFRRQAAMVEHQRAGTPSAPVI